MFSAFSENLSHDPELRQRKYGKYDYLIILTSYGQIQFTLTRMLCTYTLSEESDSVEISYIYFSLG